MINQIHSNSILTPRVISKGINSLLEDEVDKLKENFESKSTESNLPNPPIPKIPKIYSLPVHDEVCLDYPKTPRKKPSVFISYSWSQSADVDILEQSLSSLEVEIIRDKEKLKYKDDLEAFMRAGVQTTEHAIIIISSNYLTSRNCLYELFHLLQDDTIAKHLLIVTIQLATNQPNWIQQYEDHWKKEIDRLESEISTSENAGKETKKKELHLYYAFQHLISQRLNPLLKEAISFENLQEKQYSPFRRVIVRNILPQPTRYFIGRNVLLETISKRLSFMNINKPTQYIALVDGPGIGKTQAAYKLIQEHKNQYPLVLFFDATNKKSLDHSYQKAAASFEVKEESIFGIKELCYHLKQETKPWLIVYDNLPLEDNTWIQTIFPKTGGVILATTRYKIALPICFDLFSVGSLKDEDSLYLLQRLLPQEKYTKKEDLLTLAQLLDHHPYALIQAIRPICQLPAFDVDDCIEFLKEKKQSCKLQGIDPSPLKLTQTITVEEHGTDIAYTTEVVKQLYLESPRQGRTYWICSSFDEKEESESIARYLQSQNINVVQQMSSPLEKLGDFRQLLHKIEHIIVLVSPTYLKSDKCMSTLFHILQEEGIEKKVLPILTKGARVHRAEYAEPYEQHWEAIYKNSKETFYSANELEDSSFTLPPYEQFKEFLSQLLENKWRVMLLMSLEDFQKDNYSLLQSILKQNNLPQPTQHFLGREILLKEMQTYLVPSNIYTWGMPAKIGVLRGVGGLGKTQLARRFANDYKAYYRLIFFFDSETQMTLTQSYLNLAHQLEIDKGGSDLGKMDLIALKKYTHSHLKHYEPYLFVYDNVELDDANWTQFEQELPTSGGYIVITTRRYNESGNGHIFNVETLSLNDGMKLLKQFISAEKYTEENLQLLVEVLEKVPLALSQAGKFIGQSNSTTHAYLELLQKQQQNFHGSDFLNPIASTCNTALAALEKVNPYAKTLLGLVSYLAATPIDINWLVYPQSLSVTLKLKINLALQHLASYGMIIVDEKKQAFTLHRLVQKYIRELLKKDAVQSINGALKILEQQWKSYESEKVQKRWLVGDQLLPHVEMIAQYSQDEKIDIISLATILNQAGKYAYASGKIRKSLDFYIQSLEILKIKYGNNLHVMQSLANLGNVYSSLGDYQNSIKYQQDSLKIAIELKNQEGVRTVYSNLGVIYRSLGDYQKVIECEKNVLQISQSFKDQSRMRIAYENLSMAHNFLEEYPYVIEYAEKTLKISQELGEQLGIGQAYHNLGLAYHSLGKYREAIDNYEKYLEIAFNISKSPILMPKPLMIIPEMINKIKNIEEKLKTVNTLFVQKHLESIYQDGIQLISTEVKKQSSQENTFKIALELNHLFSSIGIQDNTAVLKSFVKVYRVFLELAWYQSITRQKSSYQDPGEIFIAQSKKIKAILPKDNVAIRFEYKCAKQAGKFLSTTEKIYFQYVDQLNNLVDTNSSLSIISITQTAKVLVSHVEKDWIKDWYLDIYRIRWLSSNIQTEDDFKIFIIPNIELFEKKGYQYSLCLAMILMELIKKSEVEDKVKYLSIGHFIHLLTLRDQDRVSNFLNILPQSEKSIEIHKKADRYYLTRKMVLQEIGELIKDERFKYFKYEVSRAFLSIKIQTHYEDEKVVIQKKLEELKNQEKEYKDYIQETEEFLASVQGSNRAGDDEEMQQAEEDLLIAQANKRDVDVEIENVNLIKILVENFNHEEEKLLNEINSILF